MARWRLGTMGFAYNDWRSVFYPPKLAVADRLGFYATQFDAIELNTTFYHVPSPERVATWAGSVGEDFRFAVKVPRAITHEQPLKFGRAAFERFLDVVRNIRSRLGPVLLQLGPDVAATQFDGLASLLSARPADIALAVEFRSSDWFQPATFQLLSDFGVACVAADHELHPRSRPIRVTADFLYVRLVGRHGRFEREDREQIDPTDELTDWLRRIQQSLRPHTHTIWFFSNNDYSGHAPAVLRRVAQMLGKPVPGPRPTQARLFE